MNSSEMNITTDTLQLLGKLLAELENICPKLAERKYSDLTSLIDGMEVAVESLTTIKQASDISPNSDALLMDLENQFKLVLQDLILSIEEDHEARRAQILGTRLPDVLSQWRTVLIPRVLSMVVPQASPSELSL